MVITLYLMITYRKNCLLVHVVSTHAEIVPVRTLFVVIVIEAYFNGIEEHGFADFSVEWTHINGVLNSVSIIVSSTCISLPITYALQYINSNPNNTIHQVILAGGVVFGRHIKIYIFIENFSPWLVTWSWGTDCNLDSSCCRGADGKFECVCVDPPTMVDCSSIAMAQVLLPSSLSCRHGKYVL